MADTKVTALTENTTPALTDLLYIIDDPGGSAASQKITLANVQALLNLDGWTAAGETWTYASADDPTFTFTIAGVDKTTKYYPGMRIQVTQSTGGTKYFIITKVAFSTNTTVTIYGGTDYNLENEAISSPYYSIAKAPAGFPADPSKWTVTATDTTLRTQATPSASTWYNLGSVSISIPIGAWDVFYRVVAQVDKATAAAMSIQVTLSTANNSESDTTYTSLTHGSSVLTIRNTLTNSFLMVLASKTTHYLNTRTVDASLSNIHNVNATASSGLPLIIRAVCAYL